MAKKTSFLFCTVCLTLMVVSVMAGTSACTGNNQRVKKSSAEITEASLQAFEEKLKLLQTKHQIPGMSIAVLHHQKVVLARGFGFSDLKNRVPAGKDTPYNLASCTKPIAAIVLMQMAEEGRLDLDRPMTDILKNNRFPIRYQGREFKGYDRAIAFLKEIIKDKNNPLSADFKNSYNNYHPETRVITVRHHLTHTAEGIPGNAFHYNGDLYSFLALVAEEVSGKTFQDVLAERIITPLQMIHTIPCKDVTAREAILHNRSKYYRAGRDGKYVEVVENRPIKWPDAFEKLGLEVDPTFLVNAGAGVVSTVTDLAKLDVALDQNRLMSPKTRDRMFTAHVADDGTVLPYGLGWFVQTIAGKKVVWHFGFAGIHSSLYLKIPGEEKTFILLANSGGASRRFNLGRTGDVKGSPFAMAFLTHLTHIVPEHSTPAN